MTPDPTDAPGAAAGGPPPVGAYVLGRWDGRRQVVRWADQFRDYAGLASHVDPDREAYLSLYHYPPADYCRHFVAAGYSPRGYAGPAGCPRLLFDIDRADDLDRALADARILTRHLLGRVPADGVGAYFSGAKGFHLTVGMPPAAGRSGTVPAACKRLALTLAGEAGVAVDAGCYDHQRLVRLPNTRHPRTGLYKRRLSLDEMFTLGVGGIRALATEPAASPLPSDDAAFDGFDDLWAAVNAVTDIRRNPASAAHPAVPKFVRDFIGWGDLPDPGRALTLFRCAAALAASGTPDDVVFGLLEEPAVKTGLGPAEARRQIVCGIAHARKKRGES